MRLVALAGTAIALGALDLAHKAGSEAASVHPRSGGYVAFVLVFASAWVVAILTTGSLSMAVGGGVLAGGAAGNLLSLVLWPGVPNPIVRSAVAFNLADVFVVAGFALTAVATLRFAARNRGRLREPIPLRATSR